MPQPPAAARGVPPALHARYVAELESVLSDPSAAVTTAEGDERGWLVTTGVARLIEPFVTAMPHDEADLARFAGVSGAAASAILGRLDARRLADRQNAAPSLGVLLRAAAAHPDDLEVHGYLVGPARIDERVSAEGVDLYALPLLDVRPDHGEGCQCELLWHLVADLLQTDADTALPDSISRRTNPWRPNEPCWRLWWD